MLFGFGRFSMGATSEERILITGAGGMLGASVRDAALSVYGRDVVASDIDLNEPWLSYFDVRDITEGERVFKEVQPTIVFHLAALTDLEYCERNNNDAWLTNALGTENVTLLAAKYNALLVYVSTAGIFGGEKEFYADYDTPNPLSYYGKSKYHGELFVEKNSFRYFVFRAGWMMGGGPRKDKKFINKLYKQIKAGNKELFVVDDKLGTPTYTKDFAENMVRVIASGYHGVYNQVCEGSGSRFDVAAELLNVLGLQDDIVLTKVGSDYFKTDYFAPRPASEKLLNHKLTARNMNYMRHWKEALKEYGQVFVDDYHA